MRRLAFVLVLVAALAVTAAAGAATPYFSGAGIPAGYLANPGINPGQQPATNPALAHMMNNALSSDVSVATSGSGTDSDYCNYYHTNTQLATQTALPESSYTGLGVPSPYSNWQEGDSKGNVCQADGTGWGFVNMGGADSNCQQSAGFAPCGMQHFVSLAGDRDADKPWAASLGPNASLAVSLSDTPRSGNVQTGAWGYVCPMLLDVGTPNIIEYCVEMWRWGSYFPYIPNGFDQATVCASPSGYNADQVISDFATGTQLVTERGLTSNTVALTTGSTTAKNFAFTISATDLGRAIAKINAKCGRGESTNPADYALIGAEVGQEGGGISELGSSESNLSLTAVQDTLTADQTLQPNQSLRSANGEYQAIMQPDGNFVVYQNGTATWSSGTYGDRGAYLIDQPDGNVVIYYNGTAVWQTNTYGAGGTSGNNSLFMQNDGNLVLYAGDTAKWSWSTGDLN